MVVESMQQASSREADVTWRGAVAIVADPPQVNLIVWLMCLAHVLIRVTQAFDHSSQFSCSSFTFDHNEGLKFHLHSLGVIKESIHIF